MAHRLEELSLELIGQGALLRSINEQLAMVAADVIRRPNVAKDRSLTVTISIKPGAHVEGEPNMPDITTSVKPSYPSQKLRPYRALMRDGGIYLNANDLDPRQTTLDCIDNQGQKKGAI